MNIEILRFLLNLLSGNNNGFNFENLLKTLSSNFPQISSLFENLNLTELMPLIMQFFGGDKKSPTDFSDGQFYHGLEPIKNIADKDIIYTLNSYLGEPV